MKSIKPWGASFREREKTKGGPLPFFIDNLMGTQIYWHEIIERASRFKKPRLLETGCGTAHHSIFLSYFYDVTAIDSDPDVIRLAKRYNKLLHGGAMIRQANLFEIGEKFDIIFHWGVLEHFSEDRVVKAIKKQLEVARLVIFVVPSPRTTELHGDEKLLGYFKWRGLIKKADGRILKSFCIGGVRKFFTWLGLVPQLNRMVIPLSQNYGFVVKRARK